jgi:hypothetical protein
MLPPTVVNGRRRVSGAVIRHLLLIVLVAAALSSCGSLSNERRLVPIAGNGWRVEEAGPRRSPMTKAIYETDQVKIELWSWSQSGAGAIVVVVPIFPYSHQPGKIEIFVSIESKVETLAVDLRQAKIFELADLGAQPADPNLLPFHVFGARTEGSTNIVPPYSGRDPYVASRLGPGQQAHTKIVVEIDLAQIAGGVVRLDQAISGARADIAALRFRTDSRIVLDGIAQADRSMPQSGI